MTTDPAMQVRRRTFGALTLAACILPSACAATMDRQSQPSTPDEELAKRVRNLQLSIQQAALQGFLDTGGLYVPGAPTRRKLVSS